MKIVPCALGVIVLAMGVDALAYETGDMILRGGLAQVSPAESASPNLVGLSNDQQLGITAAYMLSPSVGLEVLASTPFTHEVTQKGTGKTLAEVKHLPPTVSVQYYFDTGTDFTPYAGAGVNFFMVQESRMTGYGTTTLGTSQISVGDSIGLALSAGVDMKLSDHWVLNAEVWHIDVDTTADVGHGAVKIDLSVDPWAYMLGAGYRF